MTGTDTPKPTIEEQIEALAWLRKGWDGDNSERAIEAFNTLDSGGVFAALDEARDEPETANICTYQVGGSYESPPEYCELEIEGEDEYCPKHQRLSDWDSSIGLPELKPGEEPRPAFSDTHPRAARELGELIQEDRQP